MNNILVIDDNGSDLNFVTTVLREAGYEVVPVSQVDEVISVLQRHSFQLVVADLDLLPIPGVDLLTLADRDAEYGIPLMVLARDSQREDAVMIMDMGVFAYVTKPVQIPEFMAMVGRALSYQSMLAENASLRKLLQHAFQPNRLVAACSTMQHVPSLVDQAVGSNVPVLLEGRAGTGKEFIAKLIHASGSRKKSIFTDLKCDTIPSDFIQAELLGQMVEEDKNRRVARPGKLLQASGGTLYIHEIGSLPPVSQKRLLEYLRQGTLLAGDSRKPVVVDTRIIAGSTAPLEALVEAGRFNAELYAEISKLVISLPPLSQRVDDIPHLINWFLSKHSGGKQSRLEFTPEALVLLKQYAWPDNVRELENLVWQFLHFSKSDVIDVRNLPEQIQKAGKRGAFFGSSEEEVPDQIHPLNDFTRKQEFAYISQIIERMDGDKMKAANALGISLTTLYRKIDLEEKT